MGKVRRIIIGSALGLAAGNVLGHNITNVNDEISANTADCEQELGRSALLSVVNTEQCVESQPATEKDKAPDLSDNSLITVVSIIGGAVGASLGYQIPDRKKPMQPLHSVVPDSELQPSVLTTEQKTV